MIRNLILVFLVCIGFKSIAQVRFEEGYFINNKGVRVDCLIKNEGWLNNPEYFDYKLDANSQVKRGTMRGVSSFSVSDEYKFVRNTVDIDRSPTEYDLLDTEKKLNFKEETLFLKLLLVGQASLYSYTDNNHRAFFYEKDSEDIKTLAYKKYKDASGSVGVNKHYRQQLLTNVSCSDIDIQYITNVGYRTDDLIRYFIKYNTCVNSDVELINKKKGKNPLDFNLTIRPGINFNHLSLKRDKGESGSLGFNRDVDFGNKVTFRLGTELEAVLPFKNNKWSVFVEPTYQYFKGEEEIVYLETRPEPRTVTVDYSSIELPIGIRHYFFLKNDSKIFVNAAFSFDFVLKSDIEYEEIEDVILTTDLSFANVPNFVFGAGYKYKKYSLEVRASSNRDFYNTLPSWTSKYGSVSFIFGYRLF